MYLYLKHICIENFKGIKSLEFDFGKETHLCGRNATGKSSIADAFCWLLFNKDSRGNAPGSDKFREKPLDEEGREIHNLDTMVEASFELDGKPLVLRRLQRESWVKRRGSAQSVYQGNVSVYYINGVETSSTDYRARVNAIADGEVFSLITTLGAFNALDWKRRRSLLISMCGKDVDAELLNKPEYASLSREMASLGVSADDLRKVLQGRMRTLSKELTLVPARIDEARRMRPEYTERDMLRSEQSLRAAQCELEQINALIAEASGGDIESRVPDAEAELLRLKRLVSDDYNAKKRALMGRVTDASRKLNSSRQLHASSKALAENAKAKSDEAQRALISLRGEFKAAHAQHFTPPDMQSVCPTCGQDLPESVRETALAKAQAEFESGRAQRLDDINARGLKLKREADALTDADKSAAEALLQAEIDLHAASEELETAKAELQRFPPEPDYASNADIKSAEERLAALRTERAAPEEQLRLLKDKQRKTRTRIDDAKSTLAKRDAALRIDARLRELENMRDELSKRSSDAEILLCDAERFIVDRCSMLESSINDCFPTVRWKLFDRQINGALVDCCECMIPGESALVSYGGTNTAASVNADIEIIGVLSEHYGVIAPVFVDNAERINRIARPLGQLITLNVTQDKLLKAESDLAAPEEKPCFDDNPNW